MRKILAVVMALMMLVSYSFADIVVPVKTDVVVPAKPLELNYADAMTLALKNSVDVKIANLSIEADTLAYDEANDAYKLAKDTKDFYTTLESKYVLDGLALRSAEMGLNISKKSKIATERGLELSAYSAYYNVALAQEKKNISAQSVVRLKELSNTVQLKYKLGLATKNDAVAAATNLSAAENELKNADLDLSTAKLKLNQALTLPLDTVLVLKDVLKPETIATKSLADALVYAEANRIDVFIKKEAKAVSDLSFNITEGFYISKVVSALKKAEISKLKGDNAYLQSIVTAKIAVTDAYNGMLKIQNSYESILNSLKVMQNTYNTTKKMYELGMVSSQTVADAANGLSNLEYQARQLLLQKNIVTKSYVMSYEVGGAAN